MNATQNDFKNNGSYTNEFDEFGNLIIVENSEKYLSVVLTTEVFEEDSLSAVYDANIDDFKDTTAPVDMKVSSLESEKSELQKQIDALTVQLSTTNASEKDSLIHASRDVIVSLRIKAGEGYIADDFNTSFPYLPLKSNEAIQSDSSTVVVPSPVNSTSTTSVSTNPTITSTTAEEGVVCQKQLDIQLSPPIEYSIPFPPGESLKNTFQVTPAVVESSPTVMITQPIVTTDVVASAVQSITPIKNTGIPVVYNGSGTCRELLFNNNGKIGSYVQNVDLGPKTGFVRFSFKTFNMPCRFVVSWGGNDVIDSGWFGPMVYRKMVDETLINWGLDKTSMNDWNWDSVLQNKSTSWNSQWSPRSEYNSSTNPAHFNVKDTVSFGYTNNPAYVHYAGYYFLKKTPTIPQFLKPVASGEVAFIKRAPSPEKATVTVTTPMSGAKWSYIMWCPQEYQYNINHAGAFSGYYNLSYVKYDGKEYSSMIDQERELSPIFI